MDERADEHRKVLVKAIAGGVAAAAVIVLAIIGVSGAYSRDEAPITVHKMDQSPQEINDYWTPERLDNAKQGDAPPGFKVEK